MGIMGSFVPRMTDSNGLMVKTCKSFSFYDNFGKIVDMSGQAEN